LSGGFSNGESNKLTLKCNFLDIVYKKDTKGVE